jgi:IclR family acetate operon transcriptional repressor
MGARAMPLLRGIALNLGETVNLAVLSGNEAEYLAQAQGTHSLRMFTEVGRRVPLHCTGVGKAMLATMPRNAGLRLLAASGMPGYTGSTITTVDAMLDELDEIRRVGYAMDEGEMEEGVRCIAIALPTSPLMAVSVSGLASRMTGEMIDRCHHRLVDTCDALLTALR